MLYVFLEVHVASWLMIGGGLFAALAYDNSLINTLGWFYFLFGLAHWFLEWIQCTVVKRQIQLGVAKEYGFLKQEVATLNIPAESAGIIPQRWRNLFGEKTIQAILDRWHCFYFEMRHARNQYEAAKARRE